MSDIMHIGIGNPIGKRKEVLSVGINIIEALKNYELHKKTQKEKDIYKRRFTQLLKEIKNIIEEFRMALPEVHISREVIKRIEEKPKKEAKRIERIKQRKTHLSKLENDMDALRRKIAEL